MSIVELILGLWASHVYLDVVSMNWAPSSGFIKNLYFAYFCFYLTRSRSRFRACCFCYFHYYYDIRGGEQQQGRALLSRGICCSKGVLSHLGNPFSLLAQKSLKSALKYRERAIKLRFAR